MCGTSSIPELTGICVYNLSESNARQTLVSFERVVDERLLWQKEYSAISVASRKRVSPNASLSFARDNFHELYTTVAVEEGDAPETSPSLNVSPTNPRCC